MDGRTEGPNKCNWSAEERERAGESFEDPE